MRDASRHFFGEKRFCVRVSVYFSSCYLLAFFHSYPKSIIFSWVKVRYFRTMGMLRCATALLLHSIPIISFPISSHLCLLRFLSLCLQPLPLSLHSHSEALACAEEAVAACTEFPVLNLFSYFQQAHTPIALFFSASLPTALLLTHLFISVFSLSAPPSSRRHRVGAPSFSSSSNRARVSSRACSPTKAPAAKTRSRCPFSSSFLW